MDFVHVLELFLQARNLIGVALSFYAADAQLQILGNAQKLKMANAARDVFLPHVQFLCIPSKPLDSTLQLHRVP
jgi:hypothetical protein